MDKRYIDYGEAKIKAWSNSLNTAQFWKITSAMLIGILGFFLILRVAFDSWRISLMYVSIIFLGVIGCLIVERRKLFRYVLILNVELFSSVLFCVLILVFLIQQTSSYYMIVCIATFVFLHVFVCLRIMHKRIKCGYDHLNKNKGKMKDCGQYVGASVAGMLLIRLLSLWMSNESVLILGEIFITWMLAIMLSLNVCIMVMYIYCKKSNLKKN